MLTKTLQSLFNRDLLKLKAEIELYKNEADLWKISGGVSNSAGNLCLHLTGNLQHFIGKELGGTDFMRNREFEFSAKNVCRESLISQIENTRKIVNKTLENLEEHSLEKDFPVLISKEKMSTEFFLIHLTTHLAYHLGQINYHRRMI